MYFLIFWIQLILVLNVQYTLSICNVSLYNGKLHCNNESLYKIFTVYTEAKLKIKYFKCIDCNATNLENDIFTFKNAINIEVNRGINQLNSNTLKDLKLLKKLDLNHNQISKVPNDFFVPAESLEFFNISHNALRNPTTDMFYSLKNLKILDISYNKISVINLGVLDEMVQLEELYLNNNGLYMLELGIFDELHKLKIIDLSYNHIEEIVLGLFDQSQEMLKLNLNGNKFKAINLGTFDSLKNVVKLELNKCHFESLPLGVFDRIKKLEYLDLSYNKISHLANGIFDKNINLKFLNISHNLLANLTTSILQETTLEIVDISYNEIETIQTGLLNIPSLKEIYANHNNIFFLSSLTFTAVGDSLKLIDLSYNHLVYIDILFFHLLTNLEKMEIVGNPWECKCLSILEKMLQKRFIDYSKEDFFNGERPVCVIGQLTLCNNNHNITVNELKSYYNLFSMQ